MADNPRLILLTGENTRQDEGIVAGSNTLIPGNILNIDSAGLLINHAGAGLTAQPLRVCTEALNTLEGNGVETTYAAASRASWAAVGSGVVLHLSLDSGSADISTGDYLESDGDGTVRVRTADVDPNEDQLAGTIAQALEDVDNSGGNTISHIKCISL